LGVTTERDDTVIAGLDDELYGVSPLLGRDPILNGFPVAGIGQIADCLERAAALCPLPELGRDVESQAGGHLRGEAESKGTPVLKNQSQVPQPGVKVQYVRIAHNFKFEYLALFIHQAQVANKRRPAQVCFNIGLQFGESLGQLDQQSALVGCLEDQQP
jgi:hypothetical protein